MDEKKRFIKLLMTGRYSMSDCCRLHGISRQTGHKMWRRFQEEGLEGLEPKSRAPHRRPNTVNAATARRLIELRRTHPTWGPVKLIAYLSHRHPEESWPAPSTVGALLKREGLVRRKKKRQRPARHTSDLGGYYGPNAVWCADYKGDFRCGNGKRCYPLTISDGFSRYLLRCEGLVSPNAADTKQVFERAFREFGLPDAIRTDNGSPFSSISGVSRLSVWWVMLGIRPLRIQPGKPTQNGRHERIHRTLDDELLGFGVAKNMRAQQRAFDGFVWQYNEERPHQALRHQTPASRYCKSTKPYPTRLREPEYPDDVIIERIDKQGRLFYRGRHHPLSTVLAGLPVGILCAADGRETVHFGPLLLGHFSRGRYKRGLPKAQSRRQPQKHPENNHLSAMSPV